MANKTHFDVVGSFLRPAELKKARADFEAGSISKEEFTSKSLLKNRRQQVFIILRTANTTASSGIWISSGALKALLIKTMAAEFSSQVKLQILKLSSLPVSSLQRLILL